MATEKERLAEAKRAVRARAKANVAARKNKQANNKPKQDPRLQEAIEARRARVAAKRESNGKTSSKQRLETTQTKGNIFQKRANLINQTVKRAVRGK